MFNLFKSRKRERLRAEPFPDEWRRTIERNVPIVRRLQPADVDERAEGAPAQPADETDARPAAVEN